MRYKILRPTNDSWRVDETYIEVKSEWKYLYRAVDSEGNTLDFMLSAKWDSGRSIPRGEPYRGYEAMNMIRIGRSSGHRKR